MEAVCDEVYCKADVDLNLLRYSHGVCLLEIQQVEHALQPSGGTLMGHTNAAIEFSAAYAPPIEQWNQKLGRMMDSGGQMLCTGLPTGQLSVADTPPVDISLILYADDVTKRTYTMTNNADIIATTCNLSSRLLSRSLAQGGGFALNDSEKLFSAFEALVLTRSSKT